MDSLRISHRITASMKRILITGGTGGIGFATAKKLAETGHQVIITGRNTEKLKYASRQIRARGFYAGDMLEKEFFCGLMQYLSGLTGGIDVLINNAGEYFWAGIESTPSETIERLIKLNLQAPTELCSLLTPKMKEQRWGRIINIGSISGAVGEANASVYSASKAGLVGLTKALALELAEYGITINVINPGWVRTGMDENACIEMVPQKRWIEPEEIAGLVEYLISDSASGITGQGINLCCGLSLG